DGIFGTRTKRALRKLQKEQGWVADGYLSDDVLQRLRAWQQEWAQAQPAQTGETP
ncbi:MAG: hypothetical protein CMK79_13495, partial [Pseudomonadales bacterium]|nr:hypothetical protein [Pseudomonadales bacterium]